MFRNPFKAVTRRSLTSGTDDSDLFDKINLDIGLLPWQACIILWHDYNGDFSLSAEVARKAVATRYGANSKRLDALSVERIDGGRTLAIRY